MDSKAAKVGARKGVGRQVDTEGSKGVDRQGEHMLHRDETGVTGPEGRLAKVDRRAG